MATVSREVETGTTTLGLVCKDGVVLAADRRATAGTLIAHKRTKKVYKLDENLGLTTAGLVGDLQVLARYITAEVELYKLKRGVAMSVEACATRTADRSLTSSSPAGPGARTCTGSSKTTTRTT